MSVRIGPASGGWRPENDTLGGADAVVAFSVTDTGIGITAETQQRDLRGLRPGRRHHRPPVRRHGTGPVDQPRARTPARRRDHPHQHARPGQHLHRVLSRHLTGAPTAPAARRRTTGRPTRLPRQLDARLRNGTHRHRPAPARSPLTASWPLALPRCRRRRLDGQLKALIVDDDFRNIFALTALLENGPPRGGLSGERRGGASRSSSGRRTSTSCSSTS